MCGISGYLVADKDVSRETLERMADLMRHRGPDDRGCYLDSQAGLGLSHTRLSILDPTTAGHQPMIGRDGRSILVYNGELYNHADLRAQLESLGAVFHSRCDTEVVLRAYEQWGDECVSRFCGMFAFAVWNAAQGELFLARDTMGMKPLYYSTAIAGRPGFFFASELKVFPAVPGFRACLNKEALTSFMEFGYVIDTHRTAIEGVFKLPPGHRLKVRAGGVTGVPELYHKPPPRSDCLDDAAYAARRQSLFNVLDTVVAQHLVADVPVGVLLSGGLDSSLIAALAARHVPVSTISMGFTGADFDERPFARRVADHIGSIHQEVEISPDDVLESLEEAIPVFDDLSDDWGVVSTRLLYRRCRERGMKVLLVGEGSDEIFGGYPSFRVAREGRGPSLWKLVKLWHCYGNRRYGRTMMPFFALMRGLLRDSGGDWFNAVRQFEIRHQLPNHYVMKVDKASMSVSVEARAPYLDRRVVDMALRLPASRLLDGFRTKGVLREIAREHALLPPEVADRPKFGGSLVMSWMDENRLFRAYARGVVLGGEAVWADALRLRRAMECYFDEGRPGFRFPHALSLFRVLAWRLMQLELWCRAFKVQRS